ncbi:hypothetical protein ACFW4M_23050 [Streptomyces sp. NPDC058794]|uniref:hypothetical protein n=1 Tax=unclassified Streptomyces TaxID=2593676 RepID=UPI0036882875
MSTSPKLAEASAARLPATTAVTPLEREPERESTQCILREGSVGDHGVTANRPRRPMERQRPAGEAARHRTHRYGCQGEGREEHTETEHDERDRTQCGAHSRQDVTEGSDGASVFLEPLDRVGNGRADGFCDDVIELAESLADV